MINERNTRSQFQPSPWLRQPYVDLTEKEVTPIWAHAEPPQTPVPSLLTPSAGRGLIKPVTPFPPMSEIEHGKGALIDPSAPTFSNIQVVSGSQKRRGRKRLLMGVAVLVAFLVLLGLVVEVVSQMTKAARDVTLYQVGVQNFTESIGGGGIIFPRQQLDISYPVPERVVAVLVKAGDRVSLNQPLIQLDPEELNIQIKQAADEVAAAEVYLNTVSASGVPASIAQAQRQYDLAKSRYNALVAQASSPLLRAGSLIAPFKGVVTAVNINPGEVFDANTPLLTIMDETAVIVHVKVPLTNLGQVHLEQSALVTPSALPGLNLVGTVISVIPQADPQTDTFEIWVEVDNAAGNLLPGMSAFVRIQIGGRAISVPRMAVLDPDQEALVFIAHDLHAYLRPVQVVGRTVDTVFVSTGLSAGDEIVLIGIDKLKNGQPIQVIGMERAAA